MREPEVEYGKQQKFFELEVVSESELTKIFIQAHQALWGGGQRNPSVAFDELDKLIFCKIWDEKHPRKTGDPYDFQIFRDKHPITFKTSERTVSGERKTKLKRISTFQPMKRKPL